MKAFVINLDRSPDRLEHMRREFERIGASFIRSPGVDGALLSQAEREEFAEARSGPAAGWLPGEIGIFLSHLAIWKRIASGVEQAAAVFEDDVHLAKDLRALLGTQSWIPDDADVVRLEANRKMRLREGRSIDVARGRRLYRAASGTWGAAGYVITRKAAARLLKTPPEIYCPIDVFLFNRVARPSRHRFAAIRSCRPSASRASSSTGAMRRSRA